MLRIQFNRVLGRGLSRVDMPGFGANARLLDRDRQPRFFLQFALRAGVNRLVWKPGSVRRSPGPFTLVIRAAMCTVKDQSAPRPARTRPAAPRPGRCPGAGEHERQDELMPVLNATVDDNGGDVGHLPTYRCAVPGCPFRLFWIRGVHGGSTRWSFRWQMRYDAAL